MLEKTRRLKKAISPIAIVIVVTILVVLTAAVISQSRGFASPLFPLEQKVGVTGAKAFLVTENRT